MTTYFLFLIGFAMGVSALLSILGVKYLLMKSERKKEDDCKIEQLAGQLSVIHQKIHEVIQQLKMRL